MFVKEENKHKIEVKHSGMGIGWLAIAILAGLLFAVPSVSKTQIDCFVGVQAACQIITESYVK